MGLPLTGRRGVSWGELGPKWRAFWEFHFANPWVYARLLDLCRQLRAVGFQRYSTRTLIAVLRFEWDLRTGGQNVIIGGEERRVKLNDHHTAYYARLIAWEHPEFANFFEFRIAEGD